MLTKTSERTVSDGVTDNVAFAGRVKRYHTWPTIQNQTVGEHCWQVALVYQQIWGELSSPVERFIRLHDAAELVTGDIPFPTKSKNPDLKTAIEAVEFKALEAMDLYVPVLHPDVKRRIKICDLFEMMLFGMVERQLGNLLAEPIILRTRQAALKLVNEIEAEGERNRVYAWAEQQEDRHAAVLAQLYKEN
jgi:5'-deoxynucleotidase YfbR-like HD superfamily hydrolase